MKLEKSQRDQICMALLDAFAEPTAIAQILSLLEGSFVLPGESSLISDLINLINALAKEDQLIEFLLYASDLAPENLRLQELSIDLIENEHELADQYWEKLGSGISCIPSEELDCDLAKAIKLLNTDRERVLMFEAGFVLDLWERLQQEIPKGAQSALDFDSSTQNRDNLEGENPTADSPPRSLLQQPDAGNDLTLTDHAHPSPSHAARQIYKARITAGLTQAELGAPEFSEDFVRSVEHGTLDPSALTLEWLAKRLGILPSHLLGASAYMTPIGDIALLEEDLDYQISYARRVLDSGRPASAVEVLNNAERMYTTCWVQFQPYTRYRLYYARAAAHIRHGLPARALPDLDQAGLLTVYFDEGGQATQQVRNARGAVLYQQERFALALEQHSQCRLAIEQGIVKDWNLKMLIYSNLANDYLALNEIAGAIATYQETLTLFQEVSNWEREAAVYWGLTLAYKTEGDWCQAKFYAHRALDLCKTHGNPADLALMQVNMAELHIEWEEYSEAEELLDIAIHFGDTNSNTSVLSRAYEHKAHLALHCGALDQAAEWAAASVTCITIRSGADLPDNVPAHLQRTYVRSLRIAGLVAEQQGQIEQADIWFEQALAVARMLEPSETATQLYTTYTEILAQRGSINSASPYYRHLTSTEQKTALSICKL